MTPQTIEPQQLLDICASEKREGRGEFCPFCSAAQTILDLKAALAQAEQERDEATARIPTEQPERGGRFVLNAYGRACYEQGIARGRADTLVFLNAITNHARHALVEATRTISVGHPVRDHCAEALKEIHIILNKINQLDALPVSPPQEITEKERA